MATTVSETKVESQAAVSADDIRKLDSYGEVLEAYRACESRVTEARIDAGAAILAFLREQLDGMEADKRDTRRALIIAVLAEDTGLARPELARLVQAAALADWFAENLPDQYDSNPVLSVSWRLVVNVLLAVANRDREQAGEAYAINVHADSVAAFVAQVVEFAESPIGIDKARQALSDAKILGFDGKPVWVFVPKPTGSAGKANSGESRPMGDKPADGDKPQAAASGSASSSASDTASTAQDVLANVADCHKPGDYAGKAFQAILACGERDRAFRVLGQQSAAYAVPLLQGLADTVANCERDADGLELAKRCYLAAKAVQAACVGAFPKLSELK